MQHYPSLLWLKKALTKLGISGGAAPSSPDILQLVSGVSTVDLVAGDHTRWRSGGLGYVSIGTKIILDETSPYSTAPNVDADGRITLQAGSLYMMVGFQKLLQQQSFTGFSWFDADNDIRIGTRGGQGVGTTQSDYPSIAYFSPPVNTRVELRRTGEAGSTSDYFGNDNVAGTQCYIRTL